MATLLEKANQILDEKNAKILSENIKSGIQVFDVAGNYTADADAVADNIEQGKTAYVNGEKVEGSLQVFGAPTDTASNVQYQENAMGNYLISSSPRAQTGIIKQGTPISMKSEASKVASAIGLTAEKLTKGNTILGVEGTAEVGGSNNIHKYETKEAIPTTGNAGDICLVSNIKEVPYTVYGKENKFNYFYIPDVVTMPCYSDTDLTRGIFAKLSIANGNIWSFGDTSGNYILRYATYGEMSPGGMGAPSSIIVDLLVEGTVNTENKTITYKRNPNLGLFVKLPYSKYYKTDEAYLNSPESDIDVGGIKLYNISYNGTYMYDVNGNLVNLPKRIDTSSSMIASGNKVETDNGIVEGALTYKVTVGNGDTPTDIKTKLKAAYEACNHITIDITRSDDWANWTPIDIRDLSSSMSSSPDNSVYWLDIDIESGATLPSNKFFDLTSGMSMTVDMSKIDNWSNNVDIGDLFLVSEEGPCQVSLTYVCVANFSKATQNLYISTSGKITTSADTNTVLHKMYGYSESTYFDTAMLYFVNNMCTSTNKSTLTVPTVLYNALTAEQWKIATDKGWTVVKS